MRLESREKKSEAEATQNGHTHVANGVATKPVAGGSDSPTFVSRGDMAEVAQL